MTETADSEDNLYEIVGGFDPNTARRTPRGSIWKLCFLLPVLLIIFGANWGYYALVFHKYTTTYSTATTITTVSPTTSTTTATTTLKWVEIIFRPLLDLDL